MSAELGSHESMIRKLLDQATITYDGKEYTHVDANNKSVDLVGTYRNGDELIHNVLPENIHCKVEINFTERNYEHLELSESVKLSNLKMTDKIRDIRNFARKLIENWLTRNKIAEKDGPEEEKRKYEQDIMAAFKENGVKVVITVKNSDDVISVGSEVVTNPLVTPESGTQDELEAGERKSESDTTVNKPADETRESEVEATAEIRESQSKSDEESISTSSKEEPKPEPQPEPQNNITSRTLLGAVNEKDIERLRIMEQDYNEKVTNLSKTRQEEDTIKLYTDYEIPFKFSSLFSTDNKTLTVSYGEKNAVITLTYRIDEKDQISKIFKDRNFFLLNNLYSHKYYILLRLYSIYHILKRSAESKYKLRNKIGTRAHDKNKIKQFIKDMANIINELSETKSNELNMGDLQPFARIEDVDLNLLWKDDIQNSSGGRKTRKNRKNKTKRKRNNKQRKSKKHNKQSKRR